MVSIIVLLSAEALIIFLVGYSLGRIHEINETIRTLDLKLDDCDRRLSLLGAEKSPEERIARDREKRKEAFRRKVGF